MFRCVLCIAHRGVDQEGNGRFRDSYVLAYGIAVPVIVSDGQLDRVGPSGGIDMAGILRAGHGSIAKVPRPRSDSAIAVGRLIHEIAIQVSATRSEVSRRGFLSLVVSKYLVNRVAVRDVVKNNQFSATSGIPARLGPGPGAPSSTSFRSVVRAEQSDSEGIVPELDVDTDADNIRKSIEVS